MMIDLLEVLRTTYSTLSIYEDEGICNLVDSENESTAIRIPFSTSFARKPLHLELDWKDTFERPNSFVADRDGGRILKNGKVVKKLKLDQSGSPLMVRTFDISCFICPLLVSNLKPSYLAGQSSDASDEKEVGGEICKSVFVFSPVAEFKLYISAQTNLLRSVEYTRSYQIEDLKSKTTNARTRQLIDDNLTNPLKRNILFTPTKWK